MNFSNKLYIGLIGLSSLVMSCEQADIENPDTTNTVEIEFDNRFAATELLLGNTQATNASGEAYTVSTLNYFVSNVVLKSKMGETVSFLDQYFLVKESDMASQLIELPEVPSGNYTQLSFNIGVDSLKSVAAVGARTGVLDVASYGKDNMYWSWNMGYIFFKMEGNSPVVDLKGNDKFEFHIGGFGGKEGPTPNNIKNVVLSLDDVKVSQNTSPEIHVIFDVSKVMDGGNTLKLIESPMIHNPMVGTKVSANYASGFSIDHVH
ncbi:MAG: hypothetical protein ACI9IP_001223 [Arcticibacterium sp.]|jgi:hypothetical protein